MREREKIIKENGIYGICNEKKQGEENTIVEIYKTTLERQIQTKERTSEHEEQQRRFKSQWTNFGK
jgi:hypothetical protein